MNRCFYRRFPRLSGFAALILVLLWAVAPVLCGAEKHDQYTPKELKLITGLTVKVLSGNHYRKPTFDADFSRRFFDKVFDQLDPGKTLFTKQDIAGFESRRDTLAEDTAKGDYSLALQSYELFKQRQKEFRAFAEKQLADGFDFTVDEEFVFDREKAERPADRDELEEVWRRRLKNDILSFRLQNRAAAAAAEKEGKPAPAERSPEDRVLRRLRDVGNDIDQKEIIEIVGIYLNSFALCLGPHSSYWGPQLDEDFDIQMSLSLTGIGATLTTDNGYIKVVDLVPGGPAAREGSLKAGDRIVAVAQDNGEPVDVVDMAVSKAVNLIRGPIGTKVLLTVLAADKGNAALPETISIIREKVNLVEGAAKGEVREIPDGDTVKKVGIIQLPSFYFDYNASAHGEDNVRSCSADVEKILNDFNAQKVDSVILDLRNNSGGSLPEAISLTGLFIPTGAVVQLRTSNRKIRVEVDKDRKCVYSGPLVILTSKLSASAAEILTGALRDTERAVVVGDSRTFGKGTVLDVVGLDRYLNLIGADFPAGTATYATAMFFRPSGGSVQQLGVSSDIVLPSLTENMDIGELFMENHLPWESVPPVANLPKSENFARTVEKLRAASLTRVADSAEYQRMLTKLDLYKKYKDRKSVSLNEETRWQEYETERELREEADRLQGVSSSEDGEKLPEKKNDPILDEALHIAVDLTGC